MKLPLSLSSDRRRLYVAAGLIIFAVLLFGNPIEPEHPEIGRTLAVGVLMAIFWLTEAIPFAVTALLPVALFPALGIMKGKEVAPVYLNNILFLLIGGFIIAIAMERWNLHRRIALKLILMIGTSPTRLVLGFMVASWTLSMWLSNTATTMMMVPIVIAVLVKLEESVGENFRKLEVGLLLGIAYAASIGGMATLIGTAPNLAFASIYAISFPGSPEITFLYWLSWGLPISAALLALTFLVIRFLFTRHLEFEIEPSVVEDEYRALGKPSYEEKVILGVFALFVVLLVTRSDVTINDTVIRGWGSIFGDPSFIDDGTVAISVALILFLVPAKAKPQFIVDRGTVQALPWDIVVLLGGGFALAKGFQESGLSAYLGGQLAALEGLHPLLMVFAICTLMTFLTELTSNTATAQVVLPIIASLSAVVGVNPLLLMVPATIAASCAFMLPVATPPNAIVFGSQRLNISDMAAVGFRLNLIGIVVVTVLVYLIGWVVF